MLILVVDRSTAGPSGPLLWAPARLGALEYSLSVAQIDRDPGDPRVTIAVSAQHASGGATMVGMMRKKPVGDESVSPGEFDFGVPIKDYLEMCFTDWYGVQTPLTYAVQRIFDDHHFPRLIEVVSAPVPGDDSGRKLHLVHCGIYTGEEPTRDASGEQVYDYHLLFIDCDPENLHAAAAMFPEFEGCERKRRLIFVNETTDPPETVPESVPEGFKVVKLSPATK